MSRESQSSRLLDLYWHNIGVRGRTLRVLRPVQLLFAIIVAVLYGIDLVHVTNTNIRVSSEWVYAEIAVALSGITSLVFLFVPIPHPVWSIWDGVLAVIWLAQTGVFGNIFIAQRNLDETHALATWSLSRMRAAVWIDLVNLFLWLFTFIMGISRCCYARKSSTRQDKTSAGESPACGRDVERGLTYRPNSLNQNDGEGCAPPPYREIPSEDVTTRFVSGGIATSLPWNEKTATK